MTPEELEKWRKAGRITAQARDYGASLIKKGASMTDVCDAIDARMEALGAVPAFPAQASCDHIAAHFCVDDEDVIFDSQVVKLDVGANVDGHLGDSAVTIDLSGQHGDLVKASRKALDAAIDIVKAGVTLGEIGSTIESVIRSHGLKPVVNLSGHGIGLFQIHTKPTVPNVGNGDVSTLKAGQIIAIEPFATDGRGEIHEAGKAGVFMLTRKRPVRDTTARKVLAAIEQYHGVPFAKRYLARQFSRPRVSLTLAQLAAAGMLEQFPPLVEKDRGMVSQAEHTVLVTEDGCDVLTKPQD